MNIKQEKQMESGRTMLEMIAVLAIMGVIMYGAIAGIGFGVTMYKINATYNQIEEISQGIIDLYSWSREYSANGEDMTAAVCKNGVWTCAGDDTQGYTIDNEVGSQLSITNGSDDCRGVCINLFNLSDIECSRLRDMSYSNVSVNDDCVNEMKIHFSLL